MSVVVDRHLQCSNSFYPETTWPVKAKFYVEPLLVGGGGGGGLGHMTKMASNTIYGKTLQTSSPELVDRFQRNLVCIIGDSIPSQLVKIMTLG